MSNALKYKGYYGKVDFDPDDEVFFGRIVGIDDLITFEAEHAKDLRKEFKAAVDDYLQTCMELGKEPDKVYSGQLQIRITAEIHKQIAVRSAKENKPVNTIIREALQEMFGNDKELGSA